MSTENDSHRDERGRVTKGNAGRPAGSSEKDRIRELVQPHRAEIVEHLVKAIQGDAADGASVKAAETLLGYLSARPRSQPAPVRIPGLAPGMSLDDKAELVAKAVFDGLVDPDSGRAVVALLADVAKILEIGDIERRLRTLEGRTRTIEPGGLV